MKINNLNKRFLIVILLVIVFGFASYFYFFYQPEIISSLPNTLFLSSESQTYKIFAGNEKYPQFIEAVIDPLDVKVGDTQTMRVKIEGTSEIKWVKAKIEHDLGEDEIFLELIEEEDGKSDWFGVWKVHSTHKETYRTTFIAEDKKGEQNSITLTWTDPCSIPLGGDWVLDGNCLISGVDGVDNGNFTVDGGYTLTIQNGSTFVWNSGKSFNISDGSVVIAEGGQLKQTSLWITDNDGDNYFPSSYVQKFGDSLPAGYSRRYTIFSGFDCDDNNANKWQIMTCYPDADGDGHYAKSGSNICCGNSCGSGYSSSKGDDCNDSDNQIYPGHPGFSYEDGKDNDCNGTIDNCTDCPEYYVSEWTCLCTDGYRNTISGYPSCGNPSWDCSDRCLEICGSHGYTDKYGKHCYISSGNECCACANYK